MRYFILLDGQIEHHGSDRDEALSICRAIAAAEADFSEPGKARPPFRLELCQVLSSWGWALADLDERNGGPREVITETNHE